MTSRLPTTIGSTIRKSLLDNLALKILSLLLTFVLFFFVQGESDAVIGALVPVMVTYPKDRVLMNEVVDKVKVNIKGPWSAIRRFDPTEIPALHIDLTRERSGVYYFDGDLIKLPPGLRVISIQPPSLILEFDRKMEKVLNVEVQLLGEPDYGYKVASVAAQPMEVKVEGPESLVDRMEGVITQPVDISSARTPFSVDVNLDLPRMVQVNPTNGVLVSVNIEMEMVERSLSRLKVNIVNSLGNASVEPGRVEVTLRGPKPVIDLLRRDDLSIIVDAGPGEEKGPGVYETKPVVVGLPPGVEMIEMNPSTVALKVVQNAEEPEPVDRQGG